MTELRFNF